MSNKIIKVHKNPYDSAEYEERSPKTGFMQPKTFSRQNAKVGTNKVAVIRTHKPITAHKSGDT